MQQPLLVGGADDERVLIRGAFAIDVGAKGIADEVRSSSSFLTGINPSFQVYFLNWFVGGLATLGLGLPCTLSWWSPCGAEDRVRVCVTYGPPLILEGSAAPARSFLDAHVRAT